LKHPDCISAMAAALAHRGPDGERIVGHERARLGARRLAIMDLTTGDQPFQNPDGAIWMICNGEIYNAPDLRREYTLAGYPVPAPHTMLVGISKLGPVHLLVADRKGLAVRRYWDPAAVAARPSRLDGPATLRDALLRAVERELMSDVPVGVFTSGGLDSSLLAAAAARVMPGEKIHTYSVKFFEAGYDESPHAVAGFYHGIPGRGALRWLVNRLPTSTGKVTLEFLLKQFVAGAELPPLERHLTWFGALGPDAHVMAWADGLLRGFPRDASLNRVL